MTAPKLTLSRYDWKIIQQALVFMRDHTPGTRKSIIKGCTRALKKLKSRSADSKWWNDAVKDHQKADKSMGREWCCSCGACRAGRAALRGES